MFEVVHLSLSTASAETVPPGRYVELPGRGTTFVADVAGPADGPVLMLLHGLAVTGYLNWFPAYAPLSKHFRVISMDLRGHGRGIALRRRFRLADCADDAVALADALGIDRFIPVGYSLGGPVAQLIWHRHPERVAGMVLCATSRNFGGSPQERWFYSSLLAGSYGLQVAGYLPGPLRSRPNDRPDGQPVEPSVDRPVEPPVEIDGTRLSQWALGEMRLASPRTLLQAMNALGRFSSHDWVHEIDVPTGVVVTTLDRMIAPDRQLKLARAISGATIHPAHAGHAACVIGANRFVPSLLEACQSVAERIARRPAGLAVTS